MLRAAGPRRYASAFWIGFVACLVARALIAASRLDDLRGEELYQGSFAWALLQGMPLDTDRLPVIVHLRGSVVFGALAVPSFALLGPAYAALKTLAVLWSALAGGLLAFALERGAGRRAALLGAALAALFPPAYQMVDQAAFGSHMDSVVPTLLALAAVVARPGPLGAPRAAWLGLALGFGAFFSLQCAVAAPAVLAAWVARDPSFWRRRASLAVLVGALPAAAIPLVSTSSTLVTKSMSDHLLPGGVAGAVDRLQAALGGDLVRSLLFEVAGGVWAGWVYAAALLVGYALLVPRLVAREPLAFFALLHPLLVIGAWVVSDFDLNFVVLGNGMGSRYLMPTMPALVIALALGVDRVARRFGPAAVALAAAALVPAAVGYAALVDLRPARALPQRLGTNFAYFEPHFARAGATWIERLAWARRVDPDWDAVRPLAYEFLRPEDAALGPPAHPPSESAWRAAAALEGELRPYALVALGSHAAASPRLDRLHAAIEAPPDWLALEDRRWYLAGIGRTVMALALAKGLTGRTDEGYRLLAVLPRPACDDVVLGAGFRLGRIFTPYNERFRWMVEDARVLPDPLRARFLQGLALGWRIRFREATFRVPTEGAAKIEELLSAEDRATFRAGLATPTDGFWFPP